MALTRRLLRGEITYSSAKNKETNILHKLTLWQERTKFFSHLYQKRGLIEAIVAYHLGLSTKDNCSIAEPDDWLHGSFNLCIPIVVEAKNDRPSQRLIIRFPLPYRVGEAFRPGNADEKLRCEAGTYIWLQENCPDIPIAHLFGFGLSTGQCFTALERLPILSRWLHYAHRQLLSWLGYPVPSRYICQSSERKTIQDLGIGYLLLEYVDESQGRMLSCTWGQKRHEAKLRSNLFRSLSRIFLSLARVPLPQIGSFVICDDGLLRLTHRPLSLEMQDLENERIPVAISRTLTYSTVDAYVSDILAYHDSRLRHQPNAIGSLEDGLFQTAALTTMRAISPHFFQPELRRGPFVFTLTDLHQSNLFVDEHWNITNVLDLEWAISRPVEMLHPPYWLTSQPVDGIDAQEYEQLHQEFMNALEYEEGKFPGRGPDSLCLSNILRRGWALGTFWYSLALDSPTGLFSIFYDHIQPRFSKQHLSDANFFGIMTCYWSVDANRFIQAKVRDKEEYDLRLSQAFAADIANTS